MKIFLPLLLLVMTSPVNAMAVDKALAKCALIKGDLERLECFDAVTIAQGLDGPVAKVTNIKGKGKWDVRTEINPVDDSKSVFLSLEADSGKGKWGKPIYLLARCQSNKTDVFINWQDYLGSKAKVLSRVGSAKAVTTRWDLSTDKKATFHNKPIPFLKELLKADKLVSQITPYNESPITAIFDISGLENAIKPLRETCGW